jgi:hypothetical protein
MILHCYVVDVCVQLTRLNLCTTGKMVFLRLYQRMVGPLPRGSNDIDVALHLIFATEGALNVVSSLLMFLFPVFSLAHLGQAHPSTSEMLLLQWFASVVFILGYIGLRCEPSVPVIEVTNVIEHISNNNDVLL